MGWQPSSGGAAAGPALSAVAGPQPIDWAAFWAEDVPEDPWIVRPFIRGARITHIVAGAKVGKSLWALDICVNLCTGGEVFGQHQDPLRVVYVDQEMSHTDLHERLTDLGYANVLLPNLCYYQMQQWQPFDTAVGGAQLLAAVTAHHATVVLVDTQSKFIGGDENDSNTMTALYKHTLMPLKRLGVAVVLLDHSGHNTSRARGSSAKTDNVDAVWEISRAGDVLTFRRTHVRWRDTEPETVDVIRHADPLRHEIVEAPLSLTEQVSSSPGMPPMQAAVLKALRASKTPTSAADVKLYVEAGEDSHINFDSLRRTLREMRKAGLIVNDGGPGVANKDVRWWVRQPGEPIQTTADDHAGNP